MSNGTDTKSPLQSLGIWGILISGAVTSLQASGYVPAGTLEGLASVVNFIALAAAAWGRWRATKPISMMAN